MKVILTGATGFVGTSLGKRLVAEGHEILALVRDPEAVLPYPARKLRWDVLQAESEKEGRLLEGAIAQAIEGADGLVHLAGASIADKRWTETQKRLIVDSRTLSTRSVVRIMRSLPGKKPTVFVCASAVGYYGDRGDEVLHEGSTPGDDFLARVCKDWEAEAFRATGVRVAAFRLGLVLGGNGGALAKMLPVFRAGLGGRLGNGQQWMSWIHLEDLVSLILFALTHNEVEGVLNAVAPNPVRNEEFTKVLAHQLGRPAILPVPAIALRLALGEMSQMLLSSQRVVPQRALEHGFKFAMPHLNEALRDI